MADIYSQNADRYFDCLATTAFHGWTVAEMEAHARLIAAAPAMYAALETALEWLKYYDQREEMSKHDMETIKAVLAAARGES